MSGNGRTLIGHSLLILLNIVIIGIPNARVGKNAYLSDLSGEVANTLFKECFSTGFGIFENSKQIAPRPAHLCNVFKSHKT